MLAELTNPAFNGFDLLGLLFLVALIVSALVYLNRQAEKRKNRYCGLYRVYDFDYDYDPNQKIGTVLKGAECPGESVTIWLRDSEEQS